MSGVGFLLSKIKKSQVPLHAVPGILLWPRLHRDAGKMLNTPLKSCQWFGVYGTQPHRNERNKHVKHVGGVDGFWLPLSDKLFVASFNKA